MDILTIPEAAQALNCAEVTIRKYIRLGKLPAYHHGPRLRGPGGGYRIRGEDLELFRNWYEYQTGARI